MNGSIDAIGRALLRVELRSDINQEGAEIEVWIDTGFTGELVLPQPTIDLLDLDHSGSVDAILADGSQLTLETYSCFVTWFGKKRRLEVVANQGEYPLLGVGLLLGLELRANYHTHELTLDVQ